MRHCNNRSGGWGRIRETLWDKLTDRNKKKAVTDNFKCSTFRGVYNNFFLTSDQRPVPCYIVLPSITGMPTEKRKKREREQKRESYISAWPPWNSMTCQGLIIFMFSLRFGKKREYKQIVYFRIMQSNSLYSLPQSSSDSKYRSCSQKNFFQTRLIHFTSEGSFYVLGACLSVCAILKHTIFHFSAIIWQCILEICFNFE